VRWGLLLVVVKIGFSYAAERFDDVGKGQNRKSGKRLSVGTVTQPLRENVALRPAFRT
jgi:hypothetical protein